MRQFFVYILFNYSRTLYVGVTNDLVRRVDEHRTGKVPGFTAKYKIKQLAHYEIYPDALSAIAREKRIKGWMRAKKIALVESANPHWEDLSNHLKERWDMLPTPPELREASGVDVRGKVLRCAQDDIARGGNGVDVPGKFLRCAQDDVALEGSGVDVPGKVLRCAQDDAVGRPIGQ
jgi:putative endonuclease